MRLFQHSILILFAFLACIHALPVHGQEQDSGQPSLQQSVNSSAISATQLWSSELRFEAIDDFSRDTRGNYSADKPLKWQPGRLTISPGESLTAAIHSGPEAAIGLHLTSESGKDQLHDLQLAFVLDGADWCVVEFRTEETESGRRGTIRIVDSVTRNGEVLTRLVRQLNQLELPTDQTLSVHYRRGVIAVSLGDKVVAMGHVPRGAEAVKGCLVIAGANAVNLSELKFRRTATPTPRTEQEQNSVKELLAGYEGVLLLNQQGRARQAADAGDQLLEDGLTVIKEVQPTSVNIINDIAWLHFSLEEYARARALYSEAFDLWRNVLGPYHPEFCRTLNNFGHLCESVGEFDQAATLYQRAAQIQLRINGESSSDYAAALVALGFLRKQRSEFVEAEALYKQAVAIFRNAGETDHPEYATAVINLCSLYTDQREYAMARPLCEGAVLEMRQLYGENHDNYVRSLVNLATVEQNSGDFRRAESLLNEALRIRKAFPETADLMLATIYNNLGTVYLDQWQLQEAKKVFTQVLEILASLPGRHIRRQTLAQVNLADVVSRSGNWEKARELLEQAVAFTDNDADRKCPEHARALTGLGNLLRESGDYKHAMTHLEAALNLYGELNEHDHPDYLLALNNLGGVHQGIGNYRKALKFYRRALQMDSPDGSNLTVNAAMTLNNLATIYREQGRFAEAHECLLQALKVSKSFYGASHPGVALIMNSQGVLFEQEGKIEEARSRFKEAAVIWGQLDRWEHPQYANVLQNLAGTSLRRGEPLEAEALLQQALQIQNRLLGPKHPDVTFTLHRLANASAQQGDDQKAAEFYRQAFEVALANLQHAAMLQSTRQQVWNQNHLRIHLFALLRHSTETNRPVREALEDLWKWKGAVTSRQSDYRRLSTHPDVAPLLREYQHVSRQLSLATRQIPLPPPESASQGESARFGEIRAAWKENLQELNRVQEDLERQIAAACESKRPESAALTLSEVQNKLPKKAALIEFMKYSHLRLPNEAVSRSEPDLRYMAFVVRLNSEPVMLSLNSASELEDWIATFRRPFGAEIASSSMIQASTTAAIQLRKKMWEPIEEHLTETEIVLISPDAAIGTLPFAALPGRDKGRFLLEDYQFALLPSVRQLRGVGGTQSRPAESASLLLVGDIDYGLGNQASTATREIMVGDKAAGLGQQFDGLLTQEIVKPLPGFKEEATAIQGAFKQRNLQSPFRHLSGVEATETEFLKFASQYSLLHVATHGFFDQPPEKSSGSREIMQSDLGWQSAATDPLLQNFIPGLLSGLAFAGCNLTPNNPDQVDDGILHTLEIETASLQNVDTVVLSACETGLGAATGGEGLNSVQRAFHVAGAKTVVASLWKVDDAATVAFMKEFYANLLSGKMSKAKALQQAQLDMLQHYDPRTEKMNRGLGSIPGEVSPNAPPVKPTARHPRLSPAYWAAFQLSGDWR